MEPWPTSPAAAQLRADACCVWFGAATRTERLTTGRGGAADCHTIPGLWLDIDVAGPTHATAHTLPPDTNAALDRLTNLSVERPDDPAALEGLLDVAAMRFERGEPDAARAAA